MDGMGAQYNPINVSQIRIREIKLGSFLLFPEERANN